MILEKVLNQPKVLLYFKERISKLVLEICLTTLQEEKPTREELEDLAHALGIGGVLSDAECVRVEQMRMTVLSEVLRHG